ncbi:acridine resistance [Escherichia phage PNJ-6]|nr:acridine resistance [Escherichia phage PNJ-6]
MVTWIIALLCWSFLFVNTLVTGETTVFQQAVSQGTLAVLALFNVLKGE